MKLDFNVEDEPTDPNEEKLARVKALLEDAREAATRKERAAELEKMRKALQINLKARSAKLRHASVVTAFVEKKDGELETRTYALNEPSEEMNTLMDQKPVLFTGLVWEDLPMPEREELLRAAGTDPALAVTADSFAVFPEESRLYCLLWQRMINCGESWETSQSVGHTAEWMIAEGYCLFAPDAVEGLLISQPGRNDLPSGKPGTTAFVRAMMGRSYLAWLLRNEPPGDPVALG